MSKPADLSPRIERRAMLKAAAAVGLAGALNPLGTAAPPQRDLIRAENEKAGTTDWLLSKTRVDPKTRYRCPWIEGYCSRQSVAAGVASEIHACEGAGHGAVIPRCAADWAQWLPAFLEHSIGSGSAAALQANRLAVL